MQTSRITIFAGHYGSGKTNLALNYAMWLKQIKENVIICDLDIVNPYFRTADSLELLKEKGIGLISSDYANTNVELPSIPVGAQAVFDNKDVFAVIDLGGDDRGALALGRYAKNIIDENNYEMLMVINKYRPLTRDIESLTEIKNEIENAARVKFTGIVNNSNLGAETTVCDITDTIAFAKETARQMNLPLKMTAVSRRLYQSEEFGAVHGIDDIFPINIYGKTIWRI